MNFKEAVPEGEDCSTAKSRASWVKTDLPEAARSHTLSLDKIRKVAQVRLIGLTYMAGGRSSPSTSRNQNRQRQLHRVSLTYLEYPDSER